MHSFYSRSWSICGVPIASLRHSTGHGPVCNLCTASTHGYLTNLKESLLFSKTEDRRVPYQAASGGMREEEQTQSVTLESSCSRGRSWQTSPMDHKRPRGTVLRAELALVQLALLRVLGQRDRGEMEYYWAAHTHLKGSRPLSVLPNAMQSCKIVPGCS